MLLRAVERLFPLRALVGRLDGGERARDAPAHVLDRALVAFGVFLEEDFLGNGLRRQGGGNGGAEMLRVVGFHRAGGGNGAKEGMLGHLSQDGDGRT